MKVWAEAMDTKASMTMRGGGPTRRRARWEGAIVAGADRGEGSGRERIRGDRASRRWGWMWEGGWVWALGAACWLMAGILRVSAPRLEPGLAPVPRVAMSWREVRMALAPGAGVGREWDRGVEPGSTLRVRKPAAGGPPRPGPRSDADWVRREV